MGNQSGERIVLIAWRVFAIVQRRLLSTERKAWGNHGTDARSKIAIATLWNIERAYEGKSFSNIL